MRGAHAAARPQRCVRASAQRSCAPHAVHKPYICVCVVRCGPYDAADALTRAAWVPVLEHPSLDKCNLFVGCLCMSFAVMRVPFP